MSIITLTTDFGVQDEYSGVMKGVILSINPDVTIVDLSHAVDPQNLVQAAYFLGAAYSYFPSGTIHVCVVDPGVGSERRILAVKTDNYYFIAPDNGVITFPLRLSKNSKIIQVENSLYFLDPVSHTFHGRDIFAPVAAHLSNGLELEKLGATLNRKDVTMLELSTPTISKDSELIGRVTWIDRFGNLITNIDEESLLRFLDHSSIPIPYFHILSATIKGLGKNYACVPRDQFVSLISSRGFLEIAINHGSAADVLAAQVGDQVKVTAV